ncbi:MAG TPA: hypothetical protein VFS59_16810 [Gemmatimonadaceae bacterium]|nr:hypothetical protein [Gemmatimonadaceae bacterium]
MAGVLVVTDVLGVARMLHTGMRPIAIARVLSDRPARIVEVRVVMLVRRAMLAMRRRVRLLVPRGVVSGMRSVHRGGVCEGNWGSSAIVRPRP